MLIRYLDPMGAGSHDNVYEILTADKYTEMPSNIFELKTSHDVSRLSRTCQQTLDPYYRYPRKRCPREIAIYGAVDPLLES